jgi:L-aspartate oxidase
VLGDLEFMQFHPTAIDTGGDPMPLASEALRGEGCTLIDERGERFTDELQPRDVVARAMVQQIARGHRIFLDARAALGENFAKRFPAIHALCAASGIDPAKQPIPVLPAAHYHMGGVVTDARGRTSIDGLWACGEVTDTRLHGANRLASNSLLEAAAFGARVAEDITGVGGLGLGVRETLSLPNSKSQTPNPSLRDLMSRHAGIIRHREGLETLIQTFLPQAVTSDRTLAGLMIAVFALKRAESRGAHRRSDYPQTTPQATRQTMTLTEIMQIAESCIEAPPRAAAGGL